MKNFGWLKPVGLSLLAVAIIIALWSMVQGISYQNNAPKMENFVQRVIDDCLVTYDEGMQSIIENAQVDQHTKDFLLNLVENASGTQKEDIDAAYSEMVSNNNPQPFMFLMSQLGNTNFTITAENVQREISARRSEMAVCGKQINAAQQQYRDYLGVNLNGERVAFPQVLFDKTLSQYPTDQNSVYIKDMDGDGRLTVLDFSLPVHVDTREAFGGGAPIQDPELYK